MFNVILIIAGILEYILLGIDYKVSICRSFSISLHSSPATQANFPNTYLGGILIGAAFLNAFIEFYQLQKSEAILASFLALIPPSCRVVRGGTLTSIPAQNLVRGDIVLIVSPLMESLVYKISLRFFASARWRQDACRPFAFRRDRLEGGQ